MEVGRQPADKVGVEGGGGNHGEEFVMGDGVKGFRKIYGNCQGPGRGRALIETLGYGGD